MIINSTFATHLAKSTVYPRWLVWFRVKNISTGAMEQMGMWNDQGDITITLSGQIRTYSGAGSLLQLPQFEYTKGFNVKTQTITLSMLSPEIIALLQGYEPKFGQVEIHVALLDIDTTQVAATALAFKGQIDGVNITENPENYTAEITLVSSVSGGTRTIATKQSDGSQRLRDELDQGRKYSAISAEVKWSWGAYSDQVPKFKVGNAGPSLTVFNE